MNETHDSQLGLITDYKAQMQVPSDWNEQKDQEYFNSLFPGQKSDYIIPILPISLGYWDFRGALWDAIAGTLPGCEWWVLPLFSDKELVKFFAAILPSPAASASRQMKELGARLPQCCSDMVACTQDILRRSLNNERVWELEYYQLCKCLEHLFNDIAGYMRSVGVHVQGSN